MDIESWENCQSYQGKGPARRLDRQRSWWHPTSILIELSICECPDYDEVTSDSDIRNKNANDEETDQNINLDENDTSHDFCSRNSQLTRKIAIAAGNKLKVWLDPDDDFLLGSVTDHARD